MVDDPKNNSKETKKPFLDDEELELKKDLESGLEAKETVEGDESLSHERISAKELREQIESIDLSDSLKMQAVDQSQNIANLPEEEKIKELLNLAEKKGVAFSVETAQAMLDPYILDRLHDELAKDENYKKFKK